MPKTTKRWDHRQNIGGVFSQRTKADKAIQAFRDLGVKQQDIEEVVGPQKFARPMGSSPHRRNALFGLPFKL